MATAQSFQLGLLPERKLNWRTLATSYGFIAFLLLIVVNISLIWPDSLKVVGNYHVTELVPLPFNQPKPLKVKQTPLRAKLLPAAPVLTTPKLTVPKELRVAKVTPPREVAPPKIVTGAFAPPVLKQVAGGARLAKIVRVGEFGSSAPPTVNVAIQKVQTGGFGDPNGVKPNSNSTGRATLAAVGGFDMPQGEGQGNGTGGNKGIKGVVASAGFGNGIAQPGQGDGRSNGRELCRRQASAVRWWRRVQVRHVSLIAVPLPLRWRSFPSPIRFTLRKHAS